MKKLFTKEFCDLLDELEATDKIITRQNEDLYNLLIAKGIITEQDIYSETLTIINKRKEIRQSLKALFNDWEENK